MEYPSSNQPPRAAQSAQAAIKLDNPMARHPHSLDTALLMVELLRRIPRGRKITTSELHQQLQGAGFDRDLRTIQRQLEILSQR